MLIVGKNKTKTFLENLPETFLLIDDGRVIDALDLPVSRHVTVLNFSKHSFNPLKNIDHKTARYLAEVCYAASPQGENTLTVRNGKRALTKLLLRATHLDQLARSHEPEIVEANNTVDDILFSPLVRRFLCDKNRGHFQFNKTIIARLDRAVLGDFDCFVLGNMLISQYQGHIVVPDYGFYSCPFHTALLERMTVGLNFLDEVPTKLRQSLLLMDEKIAAGCTFQDAEALAGYAGLIPHTNAYNDFIAESI